MADAPSIDTGDHVRHEPSGETWLVAHVRNGWLAWCGWPLGLVPLNDCTLIRKAMPEERAGLLRELASSADGDLRAVVARATLAEEGARHG